MIVGVISVVWCGGSGCGCDSGSVGGSGSYDDDSGEGSGGVTSVVVVNSVGDDIGDGSGGKSVVVVVVMVMIVVVRVVVVVVFNDMEPTSYTIPPTLHLILTHSILSYHNPNYLFLPSMYLFLLPCLLKTKSYSLLPSSIEMT